jgi:hypothetical protein
VERDSQSEDAIMTFSCGNSYSRRLSGEEEGASPKRPTRTRNPHHTNRKESPRKSRYRRDSESPRSDHNSDSESTSHIMPYYRNSSSESEDEGGIPYAGAKFNSPPPAHMLPTPPMSWISSPPRVDQVNLSAMSSHLRSMLKVSV